MHHEQKKKLDRIDIRIINILKKEGRINITDLAREINLTPTPCNERVKRLEQEGIIDHFSVVLDPARLGLTICVWIMIRLDQSSMAVFSEFGQTVKDFDEIEECFLMTGDFDVMMKVRVKDMEAYQHFMRTKLPNLPGIIQTKSQVVIEEVKKSTGPNISETYLRTQ